MDRIKEFLWYHKNGDGDCNGQVLRCYAEEKGLTPQDCFDLAYFYSITYCCVSAIFLLENRGRIRENYEAFADEYKNKLMFQSDRKYVRMLDRFRGLLATWFFLLDNHGQTFDDKFIKQNVISTKSALSVAEKWYYFSRFSAYLFLETYCDIKGLESARANGMSYEGDNMTFAGGLFYVYNLDADAEYVQRNHRLPIDPDTFEAMVQDLQEKTKEYGADDSLVKLETSLCAYEKFFKGTRYNGYYADRMLEEVVKLASVPEFDKACEEVLKARRKAIPDVYLGERHGWQGIRKEMKKSYVLTGKIDGYTEE